VRVFEGAGKPLCADRVKPPANWTARDHNSAGDMVKSNGFSKMRCVGHDRDCAGAVGEDWMPGPPSLRSSFGASSEEHKARPPATRYISPYPNIGSSVTRGALNPRYMDDVPRYPMTQMEVKKTVRFVILKEKIVCDRAFVVLSVQHSSLGRGTVR
jgi:hypothetical protein